jgi:3-oxoacyl-[acyl-carrier protein] reductase
VSENPKTKTAVVTGASRGIGREIALSLAKQNIKLILTARSKHQLSQTAELIRKSDAPEPAIISADLSEPEQIENLTTQIKKQFDNLDILINSAGLTHSALLKDTPTDKWNLLMNVNARAPFILIRKLLPLLEKSAHAHIINIASVVAIKGYPKQSAYTASKHALRGMTMSLAEELCDTNINIRLLCPGGVDTDMVSNVRPDIDKKDLISPTEIAELVSYLINHKGNAVIDELRIRRKTSSPWYSQ